MGSTQGVNASPMPRTKKRGRVQASERCESRRLMSASLPATMAAVDAPVVDAAGTGALGAAADGPVLASTMSFSTGG